MRWNFLKRWLPAGTPLVHNWKEVLFVACENDDAPLVARALGHGASPEAVEPPVSMLSGTDIEAEGLDEQAQEEALFAPAANLFWQGMSAMAVAIQFGSWHAVQALLDGGVTVQGTTLYPYDMAWAGKRNKLLGDRVPVFCLAVARLAGQTQNVGQERLLTIDPAQSSPAATMETVLQAMLDHGADPELAFDLMVRHPRHGDLFKPAPPRRAIDHLATNHPLLLPHLSPGLLRRLGACTERPDSPLHLLSRGRQNPTLLLIGTVALIQAGVSPYSLDSTGHSALHHLAQSMDPTFFVELMDRLPEVQLHGFMDVHGYSVLDTLRRSVVVETDSNQALLDQVEALSHRSMLNAQQALRGAIDDELGTLAPVVEATSFRIGRQRL